MADASYRAMMSEVRSQSILVSGESGAGETETTKLIMQYLTYVGGHVAGDDRTVEQQVLESNPLLEAFDNARTVRNDNSRSYNRNIPSRAISHCLDKRPCERNYHCFYQLCASGMCWGRREFMWQAFMKMFGHHFIAFVFPKLMKKVGYMMAIEILCFLSYEHLLSCTTKLTYLNEPGVLDNLLRRYAHNEIYTYTGSILIAVNPFTKLPHLHNMHMMEQYKGAPFGELGCMEIA